MQKWLKDVQAMEDEASKLEDKYDHTRMCFGWCALNCWSSYKISKKAVFRTVNVKDIIVLE